MLSYDVGDFFQRHVDAPCLVGDSPLYPKCRSFISLVCYLADSVDGSGATRFYYPSGSDGEVALDIVPRAGRAVLFLHETAHESMALPANAQRKYIMRGDLLSTPPVALQALTLAREARMISRLTPSADALLKLRRRNDVPEPIMPQRQRCGTPRPRHAGKKPAGSALQKVKASRAGTGGLAMIILLCGSNFSRRRLAASLLGNKQRGCRPSAILLLEDRSQAEAFGRIWVFVCFVLFWGPLGLAVA